MNKLDYKENVASPTNGLQTNIATGETQQLRKRVDQPEQAVSNESAWQIETTMAGYIGPQKYLFMVSLKRRSISR